MHIILIQNLHVKHQQVNNKFYFSSLLFIYIIIDSPGIPPSAGANKTFQGFSYIAPDLINARQNDPSYANDIDRRLRSINGVKLTSFAKMNMN